MEGMLNYFIPDDGDIQEHLNVTPLPNIRKLCLKDVKKAFPLQGSFFFRFKQSFEGTFVWLDLINDEDEVPSYNGLYICKVNRINQTILPKSSPNDRATPPPTLQKVESLIPDSPKSSISGAPKNSNSATLLNEDIVSLLEQEPISPPGPQTPDQSTDLFNIFQNETSTPNNVTALSPQHQIQPGSTARKGNVPFQSPLLNPTVSPPMRSQSMGTATGQIPISHMAPQMMNIQNQGLPGGRLAPSPPVSNAASFEGLQWQGMNNDNNNRSNNVGYINNGMRKNW